MSGLVGKQEYEATCRDCPWTLKGEFAEVFQAANAHAEEEMEMGHEVKVVGPTYFVEWKW